MQFYLRQNIGVDQPVIDGVVQCIQLVGDFDIEHAEQYFFVGVIEVSDYHMGFLSGIWIPKGNLELLGNHPVFGFQMGIRKNKIVVF